MNGNDALYPGPRLDDTVDLLRLLQVGLEICPDEPALSDDNSSWSFRRLHETSLRLATAYARMCCKGDLVASLLPDIPELAVHYLACIQAGLVAVPLNYRYTALEMETTLKLCGASLFVAHATREHDVQECGILSASSKLKLSFLGRQDHDDDGTVESRSWDDLIRDTEPSSHLPESRRLDAPAFIFFTSGSSTGTPKGVTHSLETLGLAMASVRTALRLQPSDTVFAASSFSHMSAILVSFSALSVGAHAVLCSKNDLDKSNVLGLIEKHAPTVLIMMPFLLVEMLEDIVHNETLFQSVRHCLVAGDKAPPHVHEKATNWRGRLMEGYGLTESVPVALNPLDAIRPGTMGKAAPGATLKVSSNGHLFVQAPWTMLGYWNDEEATNQVLSSSDGWLDTGDVVRVDEDGYFWFLGRAKQIIVRDGSNISPQEVEEVLMLHPAVSCAGVVGVPNEQHGEIVVAHVVLLPDQQQQHDGRQKQMQKELISFCRERIGYKAPEHVIFHNELPLNPSGKIDRVALRRLEDSA